jgi:triphosphatase
MRELELKFALPASLHEPAAQVDDWPPPVRSRVWSRYFDTPDGDLAKARMAVRVRRHGDAYLQTIKAARDGGFERVEWERPIQGPAPERDALPPRETVEGELAHRVFDDLQPLFETDFERTAWTVDAGNGLVVEVARDIGEIRCGSESLPISEVELELKAGTSAAFFGWAHDWAARNDATLLIPTKNERGLRLLGRLPRSPLPIKAGAATPGADATVGEAAARVLAACIEHFCANLEPIEVTDSPEGPHQLRVALRRLRAALRFFQLEPLGDDWPEIGRQARALADAAAVVRDADVFEQGGLAVLQEHLAADPALELLAQALDEHRRESRARLRATLNSSGTTCFVLRTLQLGEQPAGVSAAIGTERFAGSFGPFAVERLQALQARFRRRVRRAKDDAGWHRVRIGAKDLRYAASFAAGALPRQAPVTSMLASLEKLQQRLGAAQDEATAPTVAAAVLARPSIPADTAIRAIALVDAWRALTARPPGRRRRAARRALRRVDDALSRLNAAAGMR